MGFFGPIPFSTATAVYVDHTVGPAGAFHVQVEGESRESTTGAQLDRDARFVGGLKVDVNGWVGPLVEPPRDEPYRCVGTFVGQYMPEITVAGAAGESKLIPVTHIAADKGDEYLASLRAPAAAAAPA
ncbi:MAG TPA: hypothetical protein VF606_03245 [Geminicoccaceae bacterium]